MPARKSPAKATLTLAVYGEATIPSWNLSHGTVHETLGRNAALHVARVSGIGEANIWSPDVAVAFDWTDRVADALKRHTVGVQADRDAYVAALKAHSAQTKLDRKLAASVGAWMKAHGFAS